ncbi:MAG: formate dehydrogenase accessory sulfurtransferase FdhD [Comamonadaceae bacterium]|nr:formate dehydrogenase accessory sulfurtransferase FdhD [Comamonadaceae bacterium]
MTLGGAPEALAIGYLRNQRLVASVDEIAAVQVDWDVDAVAVTTRSRHRGPGRAHGQAHRDHRLRPGHGVRRPDGRTRAASACRRDARWREDDALRPARSACASTSRSTSRPARCTAAPWPATSRAAPTILDFVEDVGRHNAVDAIAGHMWLDDVDGGDKIFYTTGRLTSEMVIKAAQMGIPFLVSRSGLTQMGYDIARQRRHHHDRPRARAGTTCCSPAASASPQQAAPANAAAAA